MMQIVIVKEHFFSIGIAILLLMTLHYGVHALIPPPQNPIQVGQTTQGEKLSSSKSVFPDTWDEYVVAKKKHRGIVSAIYIPMGLLTLLVGAFKLRVDLLSTAFIFGGLFMVISSIAIGWQSYVIKFIGSVISLFAVIAIVNRRLNNPVSQKI